MANQEQVRTFLEKELQRVFEDRFLWANAAFHEALGFGKTKEAATAYYNMVEARRALQTLYEDMRLWHPSNGNIKVEMVLAWREGKLTRIP